MSGSDSEVMLIIDEGTTSVRAFVFDKTFRCQFAVKRELPVYYPQDGFVEQSAEEIWHQTLLACDQAIAEIGGVEKVAGIGITNQRETTIVWDKRTGESICPAIVWQDQRSIGYCQMKIFDGLEEEIREETGLTVDPYFSASKLEWIREHIVLSRIGVKRKNLIFGNVDTWLIWNLTKGRVHATDVTNASRTLLRSLDTDHTTGWNKKLLEMFRVPEYFMPEIRPSCSEFGATDPDIFGKPIPILAAIGDQQSSLIGHQCLNQGGAKITYGTGAFLVVNTGTEKPPIDNNLLGTVGYSLTDRSAYAMEGSIFNAGTVMQWLRDELHFMTDASLSADMAKLVPDSGGVCVVPAFTGLGAPHWNSEARGLISGLTRATTINHIVRAALESIAFQTNDLIEAYQEAGIDINSLKVDGGMATNEWMLQHIADICGIPVIKPMGHEMTALGCAACVATMLGWSDFDEFLKGDVQPTVYEPTQDSRWYSQKEHWSMATTRANLADPEGLWSTVRRSE